jgi:hypothetical protein
VTASILVTANGLRPTPPATRRRMPALPAGALRRLGGASGPPLPEPGPPSPRSWNGRLAACPPDVRAPLDPPPLTTGGTAP